MILENDIHLEIQKTWYNKTKVQEDGVTHEVDPTQYTAYQFGMAKNYFIEDKSEVIRQLIKDLRYTAIELERLLEKEQEKEESRYQLCQ